MKKLKLLPLNCYCFLKIVRLLFISSFLIVIFENKIVYSNTIDQSAQNTTNFKIINGVKKEYKAPEIKGIVKWFNTKNTPINLSELKGKVILVDFWTYSCINCIRTIPYLNDWYNKYKNSGFIVIGVHSPEYAFERDSDNVLNAILKYKIQYPVASDNKYSTWKNFNNTFWPSVYLIDQSGNVVYEHFGEGRYEETEKNIQTLLNINENEKVTKTIITPEIRLGYERGSNYSSPERVFINKTQEFTFPQILEEDTWALNGQWSIESEKVVSKNMNSSIKFHFRGKKVYIVMGTKLSKGISVEAKLNGKPLLLEAGEDVSNSKIQVKNFKLYYAVSLENYSSSILELTSSEPGLEIYSFTSDDV
jgi:thiol-disulfide isomerase/thioredoxin